MEHLVLSCLESRLEEDRSIYGRFLIGPFKVGQGATVATALRRALLSELRGVAITGVSIRGAAHEYASVEGVRESALDIILNLKQIVLTGQASHELPAMGHVSVHGPRVVRAKDLKLPAGVQCVDGNQYIATVSSTGVLAMKLLISAGKGYLVHQPVSDESTRSSPLAPRLREGRMMDWALPTSKKAPDGGGPLLEKPTLGAPSTWGRAPLDLRHKRALSISRRRAPCVSGDAQDIVRYGDMRRFAARPSSAASPTRVGERRLLEPSELTAPSNLSHRAASQLDGGKVAGSGHAMQVGNARANKLSTARPLPRGVERDHLPKQVVPGYGFDPNRWERLTEPMWPIDAVFMPISKVNFLIQTDDQWPKPRERVILEVWSNGSIHPRQAITESASFLVHLFSLFRQAEPLAMGGLAHRPGGQAHHLGLSVVDRSPAQANGAGRGRSSRVRTYADLRMGAVLAMPSDRGGGNGSSQPVRDGKGLSGREAGPPLMGRAGQQGFLGVSPKDALESRAADGDTSSHHSFTRTPRISTGRHESVDVGNLGISVQAYVVLKQAGIQTLHDLLTGSRGLIGGGDQDKEALMGGLAHRGGGQAHHLDEIWEALAGIGLAGAL